MKNTKLFLTILFGLLIGLQAQSVTIGTGTSTNLSLPMNSYYGYSYSQSIYYQSEIMTGMPITKIAYQYTGATWTDTDIKIFMAHTAKATFASPDDWVPLADMTEVFSGSVTVAAGWVEITLTTPFIYNGNDNLVIAFDENTDGYHAYNDLFYATETSGFDRSIVNFGDWTNPNPATPGAGYLKAGYANIWLKSPATTPEFNIVPSLNDYGLTPANTTKLQNFVVKNNGVGFLDIADGDITIAGTDAASFILENITFPIHLAANETVTIPVNFAPTSGGDKSAYLHIVDNTTKAVHEIVLSGTAYLPAGLPYNENFEGAMFPPLYWQMLYGQLTVPSIVTPSIYGWYESNFGNNTVNSKGAKVSLWGTNTANWLTTPAIDLGSIENNSVLKFDVALTKSYTSQDPELTGIDDRFAIVISPDNGATWSSANVLRQYDNASGSTHVLNSFTPTKTSVELALAGYSGVVKIGFYTESTVYNADNELHIDNIMVDAGSAVGENNLPVVTTLAQNYPNPFNPTTSINFSNNLTGVVKLTVQNAKGETIATLLNNSVSAGNHSVSFNGSKFNSGVYFYKLETPTATLTKKMLLVK